MELDSWNLNEELAMLSGQEIGHPSWKMCAALMKERQHNTEYSSLDDFFFEKYQETYEVDLSVDKSAIKKARNYSRSETRRLRTALANLGIDMDMFLNNKIANRRNSDNRITYQITHLVATFFNYMLDVIIPNYGWEAKHIGSEKNPVCIYIPEKCLIELRNRLKDALYSVDHSEDVVTNELKKFEKRTKCPPIGTYSPLSLLTNEAVSYWRDEYDEKLSPQEWQSYAEQVEFYYRTQWIVAFKEAARKLLNEYLKKNNS